MKRLLLVLFVCLQTFAAGSLVAGSNLSAYPAIMDSFYQCQRLTQSSDESETQQSGEETEEEEEPECD